VTPVAGLNLLTEKVSRFADQDSNSEDLFEVMSK